MAIPIDILGFHNKKTTRGPVNPLDLSTIVSIFPREVHDYKHTLQPGDWTIPSGTKEKPGILVVGPSSWWREIDPDQPLLEIPVSSIAIAESVCKDYTNGILGVDDERCPGLFYVPGKHAAESVKKEFSSALERANQKQIAWYQILVRMADSLWARSNGNPLAICLDMRLAASELGLTKDWMKETTQQDMIKCAFCGNLRNPQFPICMSCNRIVDKELAKKLGLIEESSKG